MKKRIIPFIIILSAFFLILYSVRTRSEDMKTDEIELSLTESQKENLSRYTERFNRNNYHFEKALESLAQVRQTLDTLNANLSEKEMIELRILRNRSSVHLEKLKVILKEYEEHPNLDQTEILENAIAELEKVDNEVLMDSLQSKDVFEAFEYSLNALAKAEMRVTEAAARSNQTELAALALKQAQIHIKNALLLDHSINFSNTKNYDLEMEVFLELDSLIDNQSVPIRELDSKLTQIAKELDQLLAKQTASK